MGAGREFVEGEFGWARHMPAPADHPKAASTVTCWFIHAPGQGLGYDKFLLGVVDLVDRPGWPPARKRYPGAEFELNVAGLNPQRGPRADDLETWEFLTPVNIVVKFHGISRAQAAEVGALAAAECVAGRLPAETQAYIQEPGKEPVMKYIKQAVDLWEQAVRKTVEHYRTGGLHERAN